MTAIPLHITHAGQQQYEFDGFLGNLAKWSCSYCGSGDYVLSAAPGPVTHIELPDAASTRTIGSWDDVFQTAVPEPSSVALLVIACVVALIRRSF